MAKQCSNYCTDMCAVMENISSTPLPVPFCFGTCKRQNFKVRIHQRILACLKLVQCCFDAQLIWHCARATWNTNAHTVQQSYNANETLLFIDCNCSPHMSIRVFT